MVLLSFGDWWDGLAILTRIYWMIAIPATIIFLVQLSITIQGKKSETKPPITLDDNQTDNKTEITFQLINFKNFIGFFASFGWSGLACIDSGLTITSTLLISIICGTIVMVSMAIIFFFMSKLLKTVEEDM
jgi:uncharacterized membrane protein